MRRTQAPSTGMQPSRPAPPLSLLRVTNNVQNTALAASSPPQHQVHQSHQRNINQTSSHGMGHSMNHTTPNAIKIISQAQPINSNRASLNTIQPGNHVMGNNSQNDYNANMYSHNGSVIMPPLSYHQYNVIKQNDFVDQNKNHMMDYEKMKNERDILSEKNMELEASLICANLEHKREMEEKTYILERQIADLKKELEAKSKRDMNDNDNSDNGNDMGGDGSSEDTSHVDTKSTNKRRKISEPHVTSSSNNTISLIKIEAQIRRESAATDHSNQSIGRSSSLLPAKDRKSKLDQFIRECTGNIQSLLQLLQTSSMPSYLQSSSRNSSAGGKPFATQPSITIPSTASKVSNPPMQRFPRTPATTKLYDKYDRIKSDDASFTSEENSVDMVRTKLEIASLPSFLLQVISRNIVLNVSNLDKDKAETDMLIEIYSRIHQLLDYDSFCTSISTCSISILQIIINILYSNKKEDRECLSSEFNDIVTATFEKCIDTLSRQTLMLKNEQMMQELFQLIRSICKIEVEQIITKMNTTLFDAIRRYLETGINYQSYKNDELSILLAVELLSIILLTFDSKEFNSLENHFPKMITEPLKQVSKGGGNPIVISKLLELLLSITSQHPEKGIEFLRKDQEVYPILHHILCTYQDDLILKKTTRVTKILQYNDVKIGQGDDLSGLILIRNYLPDSY